MGIAIVSGILDSIIHPSETPRPSSSGTSTPNPLANLPHRMPNKFIACVKRDESASNLRHTFNQSLVKILCRENVKGAKAADLILLGAKPHMCKEILTQEGMQEALEGKLLISIATGVTLAQMREWCPESTHIVRAMPNVPCKIRQGMTVLVTEPSITDEEKAIVQWIFSQIGRAMFLEEKHIDVATALCGSGPAFACVVLEAMTDGGVMMGIPRAEAQILVAQSINHLYMTDNSDAGGC
jgi:pyrroline-5-carboxylate reductase